VDFNVVYTRIITSANEAFNEISPQVGRLRSYSLTVLKNIPQFVQDPKKAYVSVCLVTLLSFQVSHAVANRFSKALLATKKYSTANAYTAAVVVGMAVIVTPIIAFNQWTNPPLNSLVITAISIATILGRTLPSIFLQGDPS
jgi:hypothetical protein